MNKHKVLISLASLATLIIVGLPVFAQDTNTNSNNNDNSNVNVNINTNAPLNFRPRVVFLAKAELKSISGQVLTALYKNKTYTINVTDKTQLKRRYNGKSNLNEFAVGNILQVVGKLTAENTMEARLIRNLSIQKKNASFNGKIESIDAVNKKFVLKPNVRTTITVTVNDATKIMEKGQVKIFADLEVGMRVTSSGVWDKSNNTLTEVSKVVINYRLPKLLDKKLGKLEDKNKKLTEKLGNLSGSPLSGTVNISMVAQGFSPSEIKIVKGTTVTFTNNDTVQHWPASGPHPAHTLYPGFDALKGLNQGESYSFTFNKVGVWPYHDHLKPTLYGKIIVVEVPAVGTNGTTNTNTSQ